jgi:hypothetical protein
MSEKETEPLAVQVNNELEDMFTFKMSPPNTATLRAEKRKEIEAEGVDGFDFVEHYVQKQFEEKQAPIKQSLADKETMIKAVEERQTKLENDLKKLDLHYINIIKTILSTQGIAVKNLDSYEILRQHKHLIELHNREKA